MEDFEKLGVFYLGREYALETGSPAGNPVLYDSKDLTTHAVCVGMTGSGKTGLCISLLEEALIDGIPAIVIDPKGDLCNLLLTFPELKPEDFRPWINEGDARKKGLSPEEFARNQAELWAKGLADWGQDGARIGKLRNAGEMAIYTPGSDSGIQVSVLKSFAAPEKPLREDADLFRERINTTVTGILNLLGIEADPIRSREHILLSTILHAAWQEGRDMDLAAFIQAVQTPPVARIGVFDIESFYPSNDRFALAMQLNNLLAAPGWSAWFEGEPLDIDSMLYTGEGKPKISIFHISHLNDAERMFFVSILLTQMLEWMRRQPGTNSLRAILYMDEIFGYLPPVANPPSKAPLLTLLKQARAFGLGIVLATQNPVDLDYKGLSNTGTWLVGRLQTERDKDRLLDGLEGVRRGAQGHFDRKKMNDILSGLGSRVFLMNNVHEDGPVLFETRWAMSYLRGPITRDQIKQLAGSAKQPLKTDASAASAAENTPQKRTAAAERIPSAPLMPPGVRQYFIPVRKAGPEGAALFYEPAVLGGATLYYKDAKADISAQKEVTVLADFSSGPETISWDDAEEIRLREEELASAPRGDASFAAPPKEALNKGSYAGWTRSFKDWLYRTGELELLHSPALKTVSMPGETERDFRIRLQMAAREKRDALVEQLREKYNSQISRLKERIRAAGHAVEREKEQARQQKLQTAVSFGATIFSAFLGRKKVSASSLGRASATVGRAGRILKEKKDVARAEEKLEALAEQVSALEALLAEETDRIHADLDPQAQKLETYTIRPAKSGISVSLVTLVWAPFWQDARGGLTPAW
ncbi:MAG: DUF87 domain-containing protein [Acidobacteria bacterium]|nr:DUF87 domain-containing protein [Acidobacteriota bacterium]